MGRDGGTSWVAAAVGPLLHGWNGVVGRADAGAPNPRPLAGVAWHGSLANRWGELRAEWDAFVAGGDRLPVIEDVLGEHQGNTERWQAGLLVAAGRPVGTLADRFPATVAALAGVPGLRSALWSVLDPGAELPEHRGPNAGVLRYHLGVDCGDDAALVVDGTVVPYRDGEGVLFDDTAPHAAYNHGPRPRVTLFCELLRPLPAPLGTVNGAVQELLGLDARYRRAPRSAEAWDRALNPRRTARPPQSAERR